MNGVADIRSQEDTTLDGYISTTQAAKRLGVHRTTVHDWYKKGILKGRLKPNSFRRDILISIDSIEEVEAQFEVDEPAVTV